MFVNDYTGATADLKKAVELNPKLPEAHAYYGQALLRTGDVHQRVPDRAGGAVDGRVELYIGKV